MPEASLGDVWIATKQKLEMEGGKQKVHLGKWKRSNHSSCFYSVVQMGSYERMIMSVIKSGSPDKNVV